jgi:histidinol-phosphate aminotransferase
MDFSNQSVLDLTDKYDNLVVLKTCSKALGCASIRLGFAVSSKEIADVLNALRPPYNINSFTQTVGRLILSDTDYKSRCVDMIIESRNHLYQQLLQLAEETEIGKVYPSETNYIYIETDQACSIWEELKRRSILVRCLEKGLRITAGTKEDNFILIKALNEIMNM